LGLGRGWRHFLGTAPHATRRGDLGPDEVCLSVAEMSLPPPPATSGVNDHVDVRLTVGGLPPLQLFRPGLDGARMFVSQILTRCKSRHGRASPYVFGWEIGAVSVILSFFHPMQIVAALTNQT
jgi:hypothetical protein